MSAVIILTTPAELEVLVKRAVREVLDEEPAETKRELTELELKKARKRMRRFGRGT